MRYKHIFLLACLLVPSVDAFLSYQRSKPMSFVCLRGSPDDEGPEETSKRMEMVRALQKSFYQNEDAILPPKQGSAIMENLPLWRVQWTELPGLQNVLNVHVPHYTNMFQKIIHSDTNPKFFGHIYLPGGSENLDNPEYRLESGSKASLTGVLMQISDYTQMDDGRLVMIVQALEKFRIVEAKRHHSPYAIATVEILPDEELIEAFDIDEDDDDSTKALAGAVGNAFQMHKYEARSVTMKDCIDEDKNESILVSPLSNFDGNYKTPRTEINSAVSELDTVFEMEQKVWIWLDEMIKLLQQLVDPMAKEAIPIPTQILGLLPKEPTAPWPDSFILEDYAKKLEIEKLLVGTYSKSPFVRVDNMEGYSSLRRAQRLSFVIWTLTDTVSALANEIDYSRQDVLEMDSTEERLEAAIAKLELICQVIRELLNSS